LVGRIYSEEEKRIASQQLPSKELHSQFIEAGYTDRSEGSIKAWRLNKCRSRNYKTRKPKQKPKVTDRKTGLRDALGCYDYAY